MPYERADNEEMTMDITIATNVLGGVAIGAGTAFIGYIKSQPDGENFDWKKFTPPVIIGAAAGVIATVNHVDMTAAQNILASAGIVTLVNYMWLAFLKTATNKGWFGLSRW
jgi:hypothetical protein